MFSKKLKGYYPKNYGSGKLLIIEAKNLSGGRWDVVIPKMYDSMGFDEFPNVYA